MGLFSLVVYALFPKWIGVQAFYGFLSKQGFSKAAVSKEFVLDIVEKAQRLSEFTSVGKGLGARCAGFTETLELNALQVALLLRLPPSENQLFGDSESIVRLMDKHRIPRAK